MKIGGVVLPRNASAADAVSVATVSNPLQRRPKGYLERVLMDTCLVLGVVGLDMVLRKSQYQCPYGRFILRARRSSSNGCEGPKLPLF